MRTTPPDTPVKSAAIHGAEKRESAVNDASARYRLNQYDNRYMIYCVFTVHLLM